VSRGTDGASSRVGIAVVGFGNAGRQHVEAIGAVPDALLVAVVDTDPDGVRRATDARLPVLPLSTVLADPTVGLVALCVPPGERPSLTEAALAAGKHLLVEKPPARSAAELEDLLLAAARARRLAGVMFQHRYALPEPLRTGAPERFANGVATLLIARPRAAAHYRAGWRSRPETAAGGVAVHLGVHYLDLACQLLGEPVAVRPLSRTDATPGIDVEVCGHVSFRCGAEMSVTVTSRVAVRYEQLTVLGEHDWVELRSGAATGMLDGQQIATPARPAHDLRTAVYQELVEAVRGGSAPDLAALSRSVGVATVLDGLLATPLTTGTGLAAVPSARRVSE
jgi:predicted dehydrogenase